jgi:hypothetical protein
LWKVGRNIFIYLKIFYTQHILQNYAIDAFRDAEFFPELILFPLFMHYVFFVDCSRLPTAFTALIIVLYRARVKSFVLFLITELKHVTNFLSRVSNSSQYFSIPRGFHYADVTLIHLFLYFIKILISLYFKSTTYRSEFL